MKLLTLLVLLITVPAFADRHADIELMKAQTVLVTNEGFVGGGRGSGILMDSTHVLTCAHMTKDPNDEFFVYTYPLGTVAKGHVMFVNFHNDLMIIKLDAPVPFVKAPIFERDTYDGEPITVIGNALGSMKWYVTVGVVSGHEGRDLLTDASVHHGNSGGPWFNAAGKIVGITDWGLNKETGVSGGITTLTLGETLDIWLVKHHGH
jgi:S1-C subfamily serine protease